MKHRLVILLPDEIIVSAVRILWAVYICIYNKQDYINVLAKRAISFSI